MSVIFDQLRISDDGKRMYVNVRVNSASYFDNIYLDSITIMTADKVSETDPNSPTSDYIYQQEFDDGVRSADLVLKVTDMNEQYAKSDFTSDLFFVYVKIKGTPDECTPCRLDEELTLGVTFDEDMLYQAVMQHTKELVGSCQISQSFVNMILLWNAFKAAVETEHYIKAIEFWELLFGESGYHIATNGTIKTCGCNG